MNSQTCLNRIIKQRQLMTSLKVKHFPLFILITIHTSYWHTKEWDVQEAMATVTIITNTIRSLPNKLNIRFLPRKTLTTNYLRNPYGTREYMLGLVLDGQLIEMTSCRMIMWTSIQHIIGFLHQHCNNINQLILSNHIGFRMLYSWGWQGCSWTTNESMKGITTKAWEEWRPMRTVCSFTSRTRLIQSSGQESTISWYSSALSPG